MRSRRVNSRTVTPLAEDSPVDESLIPAADILFLLFSPIGGFVMNAMEELIEFGIEIMILKIMIGRGDRRPAKKILDLLFFASRTTSRKIWKVTENHTNVTTSQVARNSTILHASHEQNRKILLDMARRLRSI